MDISEQTGIDKIYDFLFCIQLGQIFLNKFPSAYVMEILSKYDKQYKLMIENLCEIVLMNMIAHTLLGKPLSDLSFEPEEYQQLQALLQKENLPHLRGILKNAVEVLVRDYYENDEHLT